MKGVIYWLELALVQRISVYKYLFQASICFLELEPGVFPH